MITLKVILLIVIYIHNISCNNGLRKIPLILSDNDEIIIEILFGNPSQIMRFKVLCSTSKFLVKNKKVYGSGYSQEDSDSVLYSQIPFMFTYQGNSIEGMLIQEDIIIGQYHIPKATVGLIDTGIFPSSFDGILGFGYSFGEEETILDRLLAIKKQVVTIQISHNSDKHFMFVGDITFLLKGKEKFYNACLIQSKFGECLMDSIFIEMNGKIAHHKMNTLVFFNTGGNMIFVSKSFWNILVNIIYKDLIEAKLCEELYNGIIKSIQCRGNQKVNIQGKVGLVMGKYSLLLDLLQLYDWIGGYKVLSIVHEVKEPNRWVIGVPFLKQYTTIFNKDDNLLGFIKTNAFKLP